jgi:PEP-CTERM motif
MSRKIFLLSSLPLLAAGVFGSAIPANAAEIVGTIEISTSNLLSTATGQLDPLGNFTSELDFGFIGDSTPQDPDLVPGVGEFAINSADGVFAEFNPPPIQAGRIRDLPVNGQFGQVDDFLAFASNVGNAPPVTDPNQFNTFFDLGRIVDVTYTETANGINANFDVVGTFTLPDGTVYDGEGLIGGEVLFSAQPGTPFNDLESFLDYISVQGNVVNIDSVSANFDAFAEAPEVPEPATLLGLFAVGTLAAATLKRKQRV